MMTSVFEKPWLLLTVAAVLLVAASVACQFKPTWKRWPYLVPLLVAVCAFGLDRLVETDSEQIRSMLTTCRQLVLDNRIQQMAPCISDTYRDSAHPSKQSLLQAAEAITRSASFEKIVERGHTLKVDGDTAVSRVRFRVHLNTQKSQYAIGGGLLFVSLEIHYTRQPDGRWQIQQVILQSVNDQPMGWDHV